MSVSNAAGGFEVPEDLQIPLSVIFNSELSPLDVRLYCVLLWHSTAGVPVPSRKHLAEALGKASTRTIDGSLIRLETAGYLTITPQFGAVGQRLGNRYDVHHEPVTDASRGRLGEAAIFIDTGDRQNLPISHAKLHRVAEQQGSWACGYCHIGLIDVCADEDVVTDASGKRMISPYSSKRLPVLEHVVPRALDGSSRQTNLVLACYPCNHAKAAR